MIYNGRQPDPTDDIENYWREWNYDKKKEDTNMKSPAWFIEWRDNHFKHLKDEVRLHTWLLGIIITAVIGKGVIDYFWG